MARLFCNPELDNADSVFSSAAVVFPCRPQLERCKYFGGFFFAILARSTVRQLIFDVIPSKRFRNRVGNIR